MVHLDRRRGFGVGGGRGVFGRGGSSLKLIFSAVLSSLSGLPVGRKGGGYVLLNDDAALGDNELQSVGFKYQIL